MVAVEYFYWVGMPFFFVSTTLAERFDMHLSNYIIRLVTITQIEITNHPKKCCLLIEKTKKKKKSKKSR